MSCENAFPKQFSFETFDMLLKESSEKIVFAFQKKTIIIFF